MKGPMEKRLERNQRQTKCRGCCSLAICASCGARGHPWVWMLSIGCADSLLSGGVQAKRTFIDIYSSRSALFPNAR